MSNTGDNDTRGVVDSFYAAFLAGDANGMLALLSEDVDVRFLGQTHLHGVDAARDFFAFSADLLENLDFTIGRTIVDGELAAVTWSETARTRAGVPWENHGVDVFRVQDHSITILHENNDARLVRRFLPRYEKS